MYIVYHDNTKEYNTTGNASFSRYKYYVISAEGFPKYHSPMTIFCGRRERDSVNGGESTVMR